MKGAFPVAGSCGIHIDCRLSCENHAHFFVHVERGKMVLCVSLVPSNKLIKPLLSLLLEIFSANVSLLDDAVIAAFPDG